MSESKAELLLKKYWSYDQFRPLQKEIVESILSGKDTFALLPTGGGKSICYQVPALASDGICIVISPLISLMKDQVEDLVSRGIKSMLISSSMSKREIDHALDNAVYGDFKLLYVSPERLQTEIFIERFKKMNVSFIAVDESHCISQWGYDFRPSYLNIKDLREYKDIPILALTATATPYVATDIISNLELSDESRFSKSFKRDNISFNVVRTENKFREIFDCIDSSGGTGIVYVRNRRKCREISDVLNGQGYSSLYYHAGLSHEIREKHQNAWMKNECSIMVATNAFGMGIDKSDVRFVIHWDIPDSPEAFYQEAGRAGRDGKESTALLIYSKSDILQSKENFRSSYPEIEKIKKVYLNLANFYQLASGSGFMESFPFSLDDFCERFEEEKLLTYNSLVQLEKEGLLSLSQGIKQASSIEIHGNHEDLISFRRENESYDQFIAHLLRAFSGILDGPVKINETRIAKQLSLSTKNVKQKLDYLNKVNLLSYRKSSSDPVITFLSERRDAKNLNISGKEYQQRKESQLHRLEKMIEYAEGKSCRLQFILKYFGEEKADVCGKCDVCVKPEINGSEIETKILEELKEGPLHLNVIVKNLKPIPRESIQQIIRGLLRDDKIKMVEEGVFSKT